MEYILNTVVVGDAYTGKTSILRRFVHGTYDSEYQPSIGVEYFSKTYNNTKFSIYDVSGNPRYQTLITNYLKNVIGVIIVISNTSESLLRAKYFISQVAQQNDHHIVYMILHNKTDLPEEYSDDQLYDFLSEHTHVYYRVSAKKGGDGLEHAFNNFRMTIMDTVHSDPEHPGVRRKSPPDSPSRSCWDYWWL